MAKESLLSLVPHSGTVHLHHGTDLFFRIPTSVSFFTIKYKFSLCVLVTFVLGYSRKMRAYIIAPCAEMRDAAARCGQLWRSLNGASGLAIHAKKSDRVYFSLFSFAHIRTDYAWSVWNLFLLFIWSSIIFLPLSPLFSFANICNGCSWRHLSTTCRDRLLNRFGQVCNSLLSIMIFADLNVYVRTGSFEDLFGDNSWSFHKKIVETCKSYPLYNHPFNCWNFFRRRRDQN